MIRKKLIFLLVVSATILRGQNTEIDKLIDGELKMTFPSVYFKNNSTEYATTTDHAIISEFGIDIF